MVTEKQYYNKDIVRILKLIANEENWREINMDGISVTYLKLNKNFKKKSIEILDKIKTDSKTNKVCQ